MIEKYRRAASNISKDLTIGGIDIRDSDIWLLADAHQCLFWNYFVDAYPNAQQKAKRNSAIQEASKYASVGDFLDRVDKQLDLIAAYGLVAIDRFANAIVKGTSGLELVFMWDAILECRDYIAHRAGFLMGFASDEFEAAARARQASRAAVERYRNDPKQRAKAFVFDCWKSWQSSPTSYPSIASFARDMLDKQPDLISEKKITDWVRAWRKKGSM